MPRDCTAPPCYDEDDVMNSPVSCLPDPIQNMKNKKNTKKPNPQRRRTPFLRTVNAPESSGTVVRSKRGAALPIAVTRGDTTVVKNYEMSASFSGAGGFAMTTHSINPYNATQFPWLSNLAKGYQKFRFLHFRAFFSTTTATSAQGTTFIQIQYDNQDTAPSTLAQVMAGDSAAAGPCWYGGAVNDEKAFDKRLGADSNIYVDLDVGRLPFNWYYCRAIPGINTNASLGGVIPAGLTLTDGSYVDQTVLPFKVFFGSNNANIAGTPVSPGTLYYSYIIEFCEPVASGLAV
jgi:hypothetical protein